MELALERTDVALFQFGSDSRIGKDLLYAGLGIIKVAAHGINRTR